MPQTNVLPRTLAERMAALGYTRDYPARTVIFREGDRSDQIYVILSGRLDVFLSGGDGREIVINQLGAGQFFGEMSLDGEPRSASVVTTDFSRLAIVSREALQGLLRDDPEAAFDLIVTMIRRTRTATRVAGNLALLDAHGRLARLLLESAKPVGQRLVVEPKPTQQHLADRIGVVREMVSRVLTAMRTAGLITVEKDRIVIHAGLYPKP